MRSGLKGDAGRGERSAGEPGERWREAMGLEAQRAHERWLRAGRSGPGRLRLAGEQLRGARALASLVAARFVGCDLSRARLPYDRLDEIELIGCTLDGAVLCISSFRGALLCDCRARRTDLRSADFHAARIVGGDWQGARLSGSGLRGCQVAQLELAGAELADAAISDTSFLECSFVGADLGRRLARPESGRAERARFGRCDFRGANLAGWRLAGAVFDSCRFGGAVGRPSIEGAVVVLGADVSAEGDGTLMVDQRTLLAGWGVPGGARR